MKSIYNYQASFFLVLCLFIISACQNVPESYLNHDRKSNASLTNSYWKLLEANNEVIIVKEGQKEAFIQLRRNSTVRGFTTCNHITARYIVKSDISHKTLKFNNINITKKACLKNMQQEQNILSMLTAVNSYKINADNLYLFNKDNKMIAKLAAIYF